MLDATPHTPGKLAVEDTPTTLRLPSCLDVAKTLANHGLVGHTTGNNFGCRKYFVASVRWVEQLVRIAGSEVSRHHLLALI